MYKRQGYGGADCSSLCADGKGAPPCSGRGQCFGDRCYCEPGWTGYFCEARTCLLGCSGNGFCFNGSCACAAGFAGRDCATSTAPTKHDCRFGCVQTCADKCTRAPSTVEEGPGGCFATCRRHCIDQCTSQLAPPAAADSTSGADAAAALSLEDAMRIAKSALRPNGPALIKAGARR